MREAIRAARGAAFRLTKDGTGWPAGGALSRWPLLDLKDTVVSHVGWSTKLETGHQEQVVKVGPAAAGVAGGIEGARTFDDSSIMRRVRAHQLPHRSEHC